MKGKYCTPAGVAWVLVLIGGINWGLIGAFKYNLVDSLLGGWPGLLRVIYVLVGISALVMLFGCRCKTCKAGVAQ